MNQYIKKLIEAFDFNITHSQYLLDRYLKGKADDLNDEILKTNAPIIYAFTTPKVPDAIKIGYTDQGAWKRIEQWKRIYGDDINLLGYWTSKSLNQQLEYVFFKDHPVHKKVINRGHYNLMPEDFEKLKVQQNLLELHVSREFFRKINDKTHNDKDTLSKEIIEEIIRQMKEEVKSGNANFTLYTLLDDGTTSDKYANRTIEKIEDYDPTPLQYECIDNGIRAIKDGKTDLLMAAVMRFGKTYTTYKIIAGQGKEEKMSRLKYALVVSAKADTRTAWRNDISHKDFINDFAFIEFDSTSFLVWKKSDTNGKLCGEYVQDPDIIQKTKDSGKTVVVYATLQDLSGKYEILEYNNIAKKNAVKTIKNKHKYLFENAPDIMVIDETHFASHSNIYGKITGLGKNAKKIKVEDTQDIIEEQNAHNEIKKQITAINPKITLQCSGTPYYILASGEFAPEYNNKTIITDVSYTDMLNARDNWVKEHQDVDESKSPYFGIPNIYKFGMKLTKSCQDIIDASEQDKKMRTLFEIDKKTKEFVHKKAIKDLLMSLYGDSTKSSIGFINTKKIEDGEIFKHTIIVLPSIAACKQLKKMILDEKLIDPKKREVLVAVNDNSTNYQYPVDTADHLNSYIKELDKKNIHSIILTVYRFLTGVTFPLVDSMLFMRDTKSSQEYDQAVFRLCSRNIGIAKDDKGNKIKINRKNNVYLIDFDIARLFKLTYDSAIRQAAVKGKTDISDIKDYLNQSLETIPIYTDSIYDTHTNDILRGMHLMNTEDLLKEYIKYNKETSIEDLIVQNANDFSGFFNNLNNMSLLSNYSDKALGGRKGLKDKDGDDAFDFNVNTKNNNDNNDEYTDYENNKDSKEIQALRNKFLNMIKTILYCNICFNNPAEDLNDFINKINDDTQLQHDFNIDINDLKKIQNILTDPEKLKLNSLIYQIYLMLNDKSLEPKDQVLNCIKKLGKIDSSEVVTPPELVDKMINKIDIEDFKKAKNILLVNEKCCEFFMGIYNNKQLGKEIALKCKIVPSSLMTVNFIKKILKQLQISESIILDIKDLNNDGKLIDDFLIMDNQKIGKFDICLMNPPYASRGGDDLHYRFTEKCIQCCNKIVCVMPFSLISLPGDVHELYRKEFNSYLYLVQEINANEIFKDTTQENVGIYIFKDTKRTTEKIKISYINNEIKYVDKLEYNVFSDYEKEIINYLLPAIKEGINIMWCGYTDHPNRHIKRIEKKFNIYNIDKKTLILKLREEQVDRLPSNKVYMNVNIAYTPGKALYITSKSGKIFTDKKSVLNMLNINNSMSGYNFMIFDTVKEAENCRKALQNPLLRFALLRIHKERHMKIKHCYKYIPDIDWSDDRVTTDKGLLEVCGCPKDKAQEYAEYCKNIIDTIDNKKQKNENDKTY